jgi:hypothetical protein
MLSRVNASRNAFASSSEIALPRHWLLFFVNNSPSRKTFLSLGLTGVTHHCDGEWVKS